MKAHPLHALPFIALILVVACGGGGGGKSALPSGNGASGGTVPLASIKISISVPSVSSSAASKLRPAYVSPATQSISVSVDGGTPTFQNLSPTSPNCTAATATYPLNCSVVVTAAAGTHTLTFITYDALQPSGATVASGSALSTGTLGDVQFTTGSQPALPIVLNGVASSIAIVPIDANLQLQNNTLFLTSNSAGALSARVSITAKDADGNYIVGPGSPTFTVTIAAGAPYVTASIAPVSASSSIYQVSANTYLGVVTPEQTAPPAPVISVTASSGSGPAIMATMPLDPTVNVSTLAGQPNVFGFQAGTGSAAVFDGTLYIGGDPAQGTFYTTGGYDDSGTCYIQSVTLAGLVAEPTGDDCDGGSPSYANVVYSASQGVTVTYEQNNCQFYTIDPATGALTLLNGTAGSSSCTPPSSNPATNQTLANATFGNVDTIFDVSGGNNAGLYELEWDASPYAMWFLRKIIIGSGGSVTTMAVLGDGEYSPGPLASPSASPPSGVAQIEGPEYQAVTADSSGNIYLVDWDSGAIAKIDSNFQTLSTLAGDGSSGGIVDGVGAGSGSAQIEAVDGMSFVPSSTGPGAIVFSDSDDFSSSYTDATYLRRLDLASLQVTTIAGTNPGVSFGAGAAHRRQSQIRVVSRERATLQQRRRPRVRMEIAAGTTLDGLGPFAILGVYQLGSQQYLPTQNLVIFSDPNLNLVRELAL